MNVLGFYLNNKDEDIRDMSNLLEPVISQTRLCGVQSNIHRSNQSNTKRDALAFILKHQTIILCTHGWDRHLFYSLADDDILIDDYEDGEDNVCILSGKRVVAISCCTGHKLIHSAIKKGCVAYLGFKKAFRIHANQEFDEEKVKESLAVYNNVLFNVLTKAICKNWKFGQIEIAINRRVMNTRNNSSFESKLYLNKSLETLQSVIAMNKEEHLLAQ